MEVYLPTNAKKKFCVHKNLRNFQTKGAETMQNNVIVAWNSNNNGNKNEELREST